MECQSMTGKWQSTSVNEEKMKGQRDWGSSKRLRRDWGVSSSDWLQNTWRQDQDHGYQGPGGDGSLLLIPQETHQFFSWGKQGCPGEGPPPFSCFCVSVVCMNMCGGPGLMAGISLDWSSTGFMETGSLKQTQACQSPPFQTGVRGQRCHHPCSCAFWSP